jgi:hypothetical protein
VNPAVHSLAQALDILPRAVTNSDLLREFVDTFVRLDERRLSRRFDIDGDVLSVLDAPWDEEGWSTWSPIKREVPRLALAEDFSVLSGGPLPPLYEQLVLSYRWAEVDLGRVRLLSNLPPGLKGVAGAIRRDRGLYDALSPAGYLQFGRGPHGDYDPVCFDLARRTPGRRLSDRQVRS